MPRSGAFGVGDHGRPAVRTGTQPLVGLKFKLAQSIGLNGYKILAETVAGPQTAGAVNKTPA